MPQTGLDPAVEQGVDARERQEDGHGERDAQELGPLAQGLDGERLRRARDAGHDEVHRELREEDPQPHEAQGIREGQGGRARHDARAEPRPGKPAEPSAHGVQGGSHGRHQMGWAP